MMESKDIVADDEQVALLDWVEGQAAENLRFHFESAEILSKEAHSTLTILLAGVGGASAYAVKLLDTHGADWLLAAALTFGICLLGAAAYLILRCLKIDEMPTPANEPKHLYQPALRLNVIRAIEIDNVQERIQQVVDRNNKMADRLNRVRLCAVLTPLIATAAGAAVAAAEHFAAGC